MEVTKNAMTILERRYLRREKGQIVESPTEMAWRVAQFVATNDNNPEEARGLFFDVINNLEFLPNSPTLMNAGKKDAQLSACFVLPIEDHMEGIFDAIKNMALVQKTGGGTGFSFSRLRSSGSSVSSTYGVASGPVSFMRVFNAATEEVKQGGTRRGANMGILRVDHPDIEEFITCKESGGITNFNISVAITDSFMRALKSGYTYPLIDPSTKVVVSYVSAKYIWELLVHHAWKYGDPGIVFIDEINRHNPTPHIGAIEATNPCGEQPLLPNEACVLGSINLKLMVMEDIVDDIVLIRCIDWDRLARVTRIAVRFLDDVIDVQTYPLPEIELMVKGNRKIGLGVMGWADMLIQLGIPYASDEAVTLAETVSSFIQCTAHQASADLGASRGYYPNFIDAVPTVTPKRRNATVTTIAPTGTISMIAGASSGVEPLFGVVTEKHVMDQDVMYEFVPLFPKDKYSSEVIARIIERGSAFVDGVETQDAHLFAGAMEIAPMWHLKHQAAWQKNVHNAVSKTINLRSDATEEIVGDIYLEAWKMSCKGVTIFRDGCKGDQVIYVGGKKDPTIATSDIVTPATSRIAIVAARPMILPGKTAKILTGMGSLYVTLNCTEEGNPFECFIEMGRAGSDIKTFTEALARLISISMRAGLPLETIVHQLKDIRGTVYGFGPDRVQSVPDAIAKCLRELMSGNIQPIENTQEVSTKVHYELCPECGVAALVRESGCNHCTNCPFSECG